VRADWKAGAPNQQLHPANRNFSWRTGFVDLSGCSNTYRWRSIFSGFEVNQVPEYRKCAAWGS